MWSRETLKNELSNIGKKPTKSRGQTFMTDRNFLEYMVDKAEVERGDVIFEIGTGPGHLTDVLLERGARVVGVEVDEDLAELCRKQTGDPEELSLYVGDVMSDEHIHPEVQVVMRNVLKDTGSESLTLLSNLPYRRGPNILISLFETSFELDENSHVVLQKEQARKLAVDPGSSDFGIPSVLFQWVGHLEEVRTVPKEVFWPQPRVTSMLCRVEKNGDWVTVDVSRDAYEKLKKVVQTLFRHPRKTLRNNIRLSEEYRVEDVDLYGDFVDLFLKKRPEQLTPKEWYDLSRSLVEGGEQKDLEEYDV